MNDTTAFDRDHDRFHELLDKAVEVWSTDDKEAGEAAASVVAGLASDDLRLLASRCLVIGLTEQEAPKPMGATVVAAPAGLWGVFLMYPNSPDPAKRILAAEPVLAFTATHFASRGEAGETYVDTTYEPVVRYGTPPHAVEWGEARLYWSTSREDALAQHAADLASGTVQPFATGY